MVGISTFNVIDVESIVSALITSERSRSDRFVEQRSESSAKITAFQELNTSVLSVGTAADAIIDSGFWVPASVTSSNSSVATASASAGAVSRAGASPANPFSLNVVRLAGTQAAPNDTAQISYVKDGVTVYAESASNTFSDLSEFPGLTITAVGVGSVDLTPAATTANTASAMVTTASALVTAVNSTLNLISTQIAAEGVLDTDLTARSVTSSLLDTAYSSYSQASLSDAGIQLTRTGTYSFDEAKLTAALSSDSAEEVIAQVAAFAARLETVVTSTTSVTGSITREIDNQQSRVSSLTEKVTEAATALDRREAALTVYYSEVNARIAALQSQQSFLQQQLDVFVKSIYKD